MPTTGVFAPLAKALGVQVDVVKLIACLLSSYIFALGHRLHMFIVTSVAYVMLLTFPSRHLPKVVLVFAMAYLSVLHIYRMLTRYMIYEMDNTGPQMILTLKLTSLAFNYRDGKTDQKDLRPEWIRTRVLKTPTPLEMYSFAFYFGNLLVGPASEFAQYKAFTEMTAFPDKKIPPSVMPALIRTSHAVMSLIAYKVLDAFFPLSYLFTREFGSQGQLYKTVYLMLALMGWRAQYYFVWLLAEAPNILNGFGYNGIDPSTKREKWDRLSNVHIIQIETCHVPRDATTHWNVATSKWIKNYVYLRLAKDPQSRPPEFAIYVGMLTSAFWHGFYPGYYFNFSYGAWIINISRYFRSQVRPHFLRWQRAINGTEQGLIKGFYDLCGWFVVHYCMAFMVAQFAGLSLENSWTLAKNMNFVPYLAGLAGMAFVKLIATYYPPPKEDRKTE